MSEEIDGASTADAPLVLGSMAGAVATVRRLVNNRQAILDEILSLHAAIDDLESQHRANEQAIAALLTAIANTHWQEEQPS